MKQKVEKIKIKKINLYMSAKILDIIYHPHPTLRCQAKEVSLARLEDPKFKQFVKDLELTMVKRDGAGLAAPQVNVSERVLVISQPDKKNIVMINPVITRRSYKKKIADEGCLSVVDENGEIYFGPVERHTKITCHYLDPKGKKKKIQADEYFSRVIQHEVDHLEGILFIDLLVK